MKKTFVLVVLFVLPIVAYLFFASGVNNFGKLPTLTESIDDAIFDNDSITLDDKITVLGFLGSNIGLNRTNAFNLNQKIYKRFYEFNDFQFVMIMPKGANDQVAELKKELGNLADIKNWKFLYADDENIDRFHKSLKTDVSLDQNSYTPFVFIIDKDKNLRGRDEDEGVGIKFGYDATSVADLNNKMVDDVKIILAEYRLALKKNNAERKN